MNNIINEEEFTLKIGRDSETGIPRWQTIRLNGKLHSPSDDLPAKIVYDKQGRPIQKCWFHDNLYHRNSGPAFIKINPENEVIYYEEYRCHGKTHRSWSEPAWIERDLKTGLVTEQYYFVNDQEVEPKQTPRLDPKF